MAELTAFIVDDKRVIRESLTQTVRWKDCGFTVVGTAADAVVAEEEIRRIRPSVVITDIRMPGPDGLTLATRVRELFPETQVIVITGFAEFDYARRSLKAGAIDIIVKPIRNEDLEQALRKAAHVIQQEAVGAGSDAVRLPDYVTKGRAIGALVRAVLVYIEGHYGEEVSLSDIAELYRVTPSHLSRTFRRETGLTFLKYLTRRRMEHAVVLLKDPGRQIGEIAAECGFHSAVRFAKLFKHQYGVTPSEYRRSRIG
ncbi:MAG: response regulator transcription factor [Alkalispirochaeta sp.]